MMRRIFLFLSILIAIFICALAASYTAMIWRERLTPEQAAPSGMFVQTRDARLFVMQAGPQTGESVVLIHGTGAWGELWRPTIDLLASSGFRVTTIDVPPFGFSEKLTGADSFSVGRQADRILDVLKKLKIDKASIVCHSVGCRPAIETVLKNSDVAKKIVMVDAALGFSSNRSSLHFEPKSPALLAELFLSAGPIRDSVTAAYGTSAWSIRPIFSSFVSDKSAVTDQRLKILERPLVIKNMTQAEGDWLENLVVTPEHGLFTNFQSYKAIKVPVLIIWGTQDTVTPPWQGTALAGLFPHARLQTIEGSGHIPYIERTDTFNRFLLGFLTQRPRRN